MDAVLSLQIHGLYGQDWYPFNCKNMIFHSIEERMWLLKSGFSFVHIIATYLNLMYIMPYFLYKKLYISGPKIVQQ